jgi:DNA primase catalytic core
MNDYSRAELDELKARVDIAEVLRASGLEMRQVGKGLFARCPFHDDDQASLSVTPAEGLWNCFGCEAGGDAISFLQKRDGLTFAAAVMRLKELAGVLPAPKTTGKARPAVQPGHSPLLGRVAEIYARTFSLSKQAQRYLQERGLGSKEMWKAFGLGYADGALMDTIPSQGEIVDSLKAVGLLTRDGKELFKGCVVVPLTHPDFGVMGFYGRKLSSKAQVRHLFLPGQRRGVLNWQCLQQTAELVVTESVFDALSLWVAGIRDVSCLFGVSSVPIDLAELLGRYRVTTVTFCLDGDRAGREAASARASELLPLGIASRAVLLPEGQDPNEILVSSGPEALKVQLEKAIPLMALEEPSFGVEDIEDGFEVRFGAISYRVVFKSPGTGSLRASVKAVKDGLTFLNSLDLGSHRGRTATANQVSRRFRLPKADVESHFMRLVEEAESRAVGGANETELGQSMTDIVKEAPELSESEKDQAVDFLSRPDLVETILEDMEQLGYVGEEKGKLLAYLIGISRRLEKPLAAIVSSQSSAGKSGMTEAVEALTAPEDVVNFARLSTHALSYMPQTFLKHKLVILEERVGGEAADYSIRVLQSKQKLSQAVVVKDASGAMQTRYFEVEGPIAYLETTTSGRVNYENATRCFEIALDESQEQTEKIHQMQRDSRSLERFRSHAFLELLKKRHHDAQRVLEDVKVVIPYVHLLRFPSRWLRTRRDHERFLCLIDVLAYLHQYQRNRGTTTDSIGEEIAYVEASFEDYVLAYELAQGVLKDSFHELSRSARDLWPFIIEGVKDGGPLVGLHFTRRQLRALTSWPDRRLKEALGELVDMEYLMADGAQGKVYRYQLLADPNEGQGPPTLALTTPQELKERLSSC